MRLRALWVLPLFLSALIAACGARTSLDIGGGPTDASVSDSTVLRDARPDHEGGPGCTPKTCAELGYNCGPNADGCGGILQCGSCMSPQFCGGGGFSKCGGGGMCAPKTCDELGYNCGENADGCGNMIDCGTCPLPQFCGGGGFSRCGGDVELRDGGTLCVPKTCAGLGYNCGPAGNGCGGLLDCGSCVSPQYCGGGGFNVCGGDLRVLDGGSVCVPETCASLGYDCGPTGDGCGNLIPSCGTCMQPQFCGGGGVPSVCGGDDTFDAGPCVNLCKQQVQCDGGVTTTITGTVVAPTDPTKGYGNPDPLYRALVYVPNSAVQPFPPGVTCDPCGAEVSGTPLVTDITGPSGTFVLSNAPCGANIPLVIQLGHWRRQITIPNVACCVNNPLTLSQTRLPRNHTEGDIPLIAISTGTADTLECALPKIGIDLSEFTNPGGGGRVQLYVDNGTFINGNTPPASALYSNAATLNQYDMVVFACDGAQNDQSTANQLNVMNYANAGGRVFASHYGYVWLYDISPFSLTAKWDVSQNPPPDPLTAFVDTSFAKGNDFATWLGIVGALSNPSPPQIMVNQPRRDTDGANVPPSQQFLYGDPNAFPQPSTLEFTFNTPVFADAGPQCGRVLYSDFHIDPTPGGGPPQAFPGECPVAPLTPQEKVLEFMLFDLASCVQQPPHCTPITCAQQNIQCGPAGDGCGGLIDCGSCTAPQTCGGAGIHGHCGYIDGGSCKPKTCQQQGIQCGPAGDGCGGILNCGNCIPPETCGGAGMLGVCGYVDGGSCTPKTCQQLGIDCGPAGDGCGGLLSCGMCMSPLTCGGGGTPSVCGISDGGVCKPKTCAQLGFNCGPAGDGCGGLLQCGNCTAPQSCGGGGAPGVCGG